MVAVALCALLASAAPPAHGAPDETSDDAPTSASPAEGDPPPQVGDASERIRQVVANERRELESKRAELEQLKVDLKAAEAALDKKIEALKAAVQEKKDLLDKIAALRKTVRNDKIQRLIKLTEKMPPVEAAAYLSKLDEPTASSILQGMRVRQASKVMAALLPKKAASLSRTYLKNDRPVGRPSGGDKPRR